ncbi:MAG: hypothetical protein V9H26_16965 [Verrucomicrobiota bacterium]|nr:hypothetical protein [Limisphaerales bacterium]
MLIKRDDQTGLAFGGNKTRKLEFLVGQALVQDVDTVLFWQTGGGLALFGYARELLPQ